MIICRLRYQVIIEFSLLSTRSIWTSNMPSNHIYKRTGPSLVTHNIPDRAYPSEFQAAGVLPKDGLYPTVGLPGSRARFFCWGNEELRIGRCCNCDLRAELIGWSFSADLQGGATAEKLHHRYPASTEKCHGNHRSSIHPLDVLKSCTDKSGYPVVTESTGIDLIASSKATCSRSRIPPMLYVQFPTSSP